jgi:hypothetical protein
MPDTGVEIKIEGMDELIKKLEYMFMLWHYDRPVWWTWRRMMAKTALLFRNSV